MSESSDSSKSAGVGLLVNFMNEIFAPNLGPFVRSLSIVRSVSGHGYWSNALW